MERDEAVRLMTEARRRLHGTPEPAFCERATREYVMKLLREHTSLELHDEGEYIYAVHREGAEETIAFRADLDAVPTENGACHLCGHDGHTAALVGLALLLEGRRVGRNVILLFQPAEETGFGAPACMGLFDKENVSAMYGAHNIPGEELGRVVLRRGTFACASCGLEIAMRGAPAHAAYPENGVNPTEALARLAVRIPEYARELTAKYGCMTLATVVGMRVGEKAFGVAASAGELWVTLRSENEKAFEELKNFVCSYARTMASDERTNASDECTNTSDERLKVTFAEYDPFPATVNDDGLVTSLEKLLAKRGIPFGYAPVPFRWSEDFGHYGRRTRAYFMGIGSGKDTPPLHTARYEYPDALVPVTAELFLAIAEGGTEAL